MKLLFSIIIICISSISYASVDTSRFTQLIDYIGVDYPGAIQNGEIISQAEYDEMQEFAATLVTQSQLLSLQAPSANLPAQAKQLQTGISQRVDPEQIKQITAAFRKSVLDNFKISTVPRSAPDLKRAQQLFADNCASCHGENGQGDGPLAASLDPAPTDFSDVERYRDRTLYGLYSTITLGVGGTSMQPYLTQLNENERWALAFYVGQKAISTNDENKGAEAWSTTDAKNSPLSRIKNLTTQTPNEISQQYGEESLNLMSYLRRHPEVLFTDKSPIQFSLESLEKSVNAYSPQNKDEAYQYALSAYLDGFELIEHSIDNIDHQLKIDIETAMTRYRELIKKSASTDKVKNQFDQLNDLLIRADDTLKTKTLSGSAAFSGALIILLREGLEAILVIAALGAFLVKTKRRDGLVYLHIGWISALILGGFTWYASQYLFTFSGASREITEGIAALLAMVILLWVGFWLHSKTNAQQWQRFIEGSINKALNSGTMWGIAGLSFIAVYREVFETILFFQAMWVQVEGDAKFSMMAGMGTAAGALVLLAWIILRYSTRLPLRQFFSVTSVFMFILAIVFAGKGVAALQEAGFMSANLVNFPRIDILGIYPNIEGLLLQFVLLIMALFTYFGFKRKKIST